MHVAIYSPPELRSVGRVSNVVLGDRIGFGESAEPTDANNQIEWTHAGLDDPDDI
jgi:hypothetical protein